MNHQARRLYGATMNHVANVGLVAGTTSTYTTAQTTGCCIGGKFGTQLTAQTNTATPTTDINTGVAFVALSPNKASVFVFGINAAGAIKVAQGSIEPTDTGITTTVGAFRNPPQFPTLPDDFCPIGYVLVRTAPSAASWVFGTGAWTASGVTCSTMANVCTLPDRPQTA